MPVKDSSEKGNLYVKLNVHIPNFSDSELDQLEDFFKKHKASSWLNMF